MRVFHSTLLTLCDTLLAGAPIAQADVFEILSDSKSGSDLSLSEG